MGKKELQSQNRSLLLLRPQDRQPRPHRRPGIRRLFWDEIPSLTLPGVAQYRDLPGFKENWQSFVYAGPSELWQEE